jgi:hypothetical protein
MHERCANDWVAAPGLPHADERWDHARLESVDQVNCIAGGVVPVGFVANDVLIE